MTLEKSKNQNSPFESPSNISAPTLRQTFNTTQNWTVPDGVYGIWVHLAGGGAGGNSRTTTQAVNGTGGSGGNGTFAYTPVTPGSTVGITIGAGGNGGTIQTNIVNATYGNEGGTTFVNTVGASYSAGGGWRTSSINTTNAINGWGFVGKLGGMIRQQVLFSPKSLSPRTAYLWGTREGSGFGGLTSEWDYNSANPTQNNNRIGRDSTYGGASGGGASTNNSNAGGGGSGGNQLLTGYTGGVGANYVQTNSGGGGGGAGIAGNGAAGSGTNGGAGGAGGGGGGGGGVGGASLGCTGGAGGAGAVLIYY